MGLGLYDTYNENYGYFGYVSRAVQVKSTEGSTSMIVYSNNEKTDLVNRQELGVTSYNLLNGNITYRYLIRDFEFKDKLEYKILQWFGLLILPTIVIFFKKAGTKVYQTKIKGTK